ncbi:MAG: carboxypeptidase-like regulatory domain-containing protein [Bacteroidota bacterium]|nr:carboxypeptidase-like regulatory domain-containing protein [Bacteroidota bacterium]
MKKLLLSIVFTVLVLQLSFASNENNPTNGNTKNTIKINGKIVDKETGETLTGVLIEIKGSSEKVYSDFDGTFEFKNLKPGIYDIVISYISYEKNVLKMVKAKTSVNTLKIELKKQ